MNGAVDVDVGGHKERDRDKERERNRDGALEVVLQVPKRTSSETDGTEIGISGEKEWSLYL